MATIEVVNLKEKLSRIAEFYSPHIAGQVNDFLVKLVKFDSEFTWHHHDHEDELFLVVQGSFIMQYEEEGVRKQKRVSAGEFLVMPHGVEHCPKADGECHVLLFEPNSTLNTGNVRNEFTKEV